MNSLDDCVDILDALKKTIETPYWRELLPKYVSGYRIQVHQLSHVFGREDLALGYRLWLEERYPDSFSDEQ